MCDKPAPMEVWMETQKAIQVLLIEKGLITTDEIRAKVADSLKLGEEELDQLINQWKS